MKSSNANNSSIKTRRFIRQAFAELIKEKHDIDHINVTELCRRADITRGTFYFHYDNIYDVVDDFRDEIFETFFDSEYDIHNCDIMEYFDHITAYLKTHTDIYKMLISAHNIPNFTDHLKHHLYKKLILCLEKHQHRTSSNLELDAEFFTDGAVCLLVKFFQNQTPLTLDEINTYLKTMFRRIFAN